MGILDKKSYADNKIYVDKIYLWHGNEYINTGVFYQNNSDKNYMESDIRRLCPNTLSVSKRLFDILGFKMGGKYTFNDLIDVDLNKYLLDTKDNKCVHSIRMALLKNGYLNEKDREYLVSIGFKEEDLCRTIEELNFPTRVHKSLLRTIPYYFNERDGEEGTLAIPELALLPEEYLATIRGMGRSSIMQIETTLNSLGYPLRSAKEEELSEKVDEDLPNQIAIRQSLDKCHKIIAAREKYIEKASAYLDKVDQKDKQLQEELVKIRTMLRG